MTKTILVVDDKASVRTLVQEYLAEEGFRVVTAANGREALFAARHEKPNLILLDLMMPEMGGYEFMRLYSRESDTPIILLTAKVEESDRVLGLELGWQKQSLSSMAQLPPTKKRCWDLRRS